MNENYEPSTLDAMVGRYKYLNLDPLNAVQLTPNVLGMFAPSMSAKGVVV